MVTLLSVERVKGTGERLQFACMYRCYEAIAILLTVESKYMHTAFQIDLKDIGTYRGFFSELPIKLWFCCMEREEKEASKDVSPLSLIVIVLQSSYFVLVWLCIVLRCWYYCRSCSMNKSESRF